jgi:hypothetical protein
MHHVCKPKRMLTGLLAVALAALFVQAAAAHQMSQNDNTFAAVTVSNSSTTAKAPFVIPYLSHGVGVDTSLYSGTSKGSSKRPLVIPYLSHGVGVDASLYSGTAQARKVLRRAGGYYDVVRGIFVPAHVTTGATFKSTAVRPEASSGYYDVVRGVFVPAHAASSSTSQSTAVRPDNRAGIRGINASDIASQLQATAVRPDDRGGLRGI